jgi:hypothetical protein
LPAPYIVSHSTISRYYALKEVKAAIVRQQGTQGSAELKMRVTAYLDGHPEIVSRAAKTVHNDPALRRMAERHERHRLTRASA